MRRHTFALGIGLAASLLAGLACGRGAEEKTRVGTDALAVEATLDPPTPRTGANQMEILVLGADGRPVADAEVDVKVSMQSMGAMPAMGGPAAVKPMGDGRFRADFNLDMEGTWRVDVRARTPDGAALRVEGSLLTGQPGLRLSSRGGTATPATRADAGASEAAPPQTEIVVDPGRRQAIGVRVAPVLREPFGVTIRAVGVVGYDQGAVRDVAPRVGGTLGRIRVPGVGDSVRAGDVLFTLYSPALFAAQKELLAASDNPGGEALTRAARGRLRLWGMAESDIERLLASRTPIEQVPFHAPESGVVVEKNVVDGSGTIAGERLFRIAAVDSVWIEAELYEADLALVRAGDAARITLPYLPGERFEGRVSLVTPFLDGATRTARARVEIGNPGRALLPGMFASVELRRELGDRVVVPASAVLYTGLRRFVFVDLGEGRLRPRAVETGLRDGERLEVLSGLEAGERIVVSGNYLIASESRLGTALEQW